MTQIFPCLKMFKSQISEESNVMNHKNKCQCRPRFKSPPNLATATSEPRKHAGLFPDDEILGFDNQFFNIPDKEAKYWPPCLRLCLEKSYESLQLHGYTRETVKGQSIALYNGVLMRIMPC